jgi:hypothetical protein
VAFYDVPARRISSIKNVAGVPPPDDGLGSYSLNSDQVFAIAKVLETPIDDKTIDFSCRHMMRAPIKLPPAD